MTNPAPAPTRSVWLVVCGALCAAPILYGVLAPMVAPDVQPAPTLALMRTAFAGAATLGFLLATYLMRRVARAADPGQGLFALRPEGELATPAAFQLRSIFAMALFESVAIFGFVLVFLGAPPEQAWVWSAASFAGMVGIALPAGLAYWRELERAGQGGAAPIG